MSMGYAAYLVGKEGGWERQAVPLALYGTQLALNVAWSPLFFGAKKLGAALVDIGLLDVAVAATAYSLYEPQGLCWLLARALRLTSSLPLGGVAMA